MADDTNNIKPGQVVPSNGRTQGGWQLFGFTISRDQKEEDLKQKNQVSFAAPQNDDGAVTIQTGAYFGTYVDLEGVVRNEVELITRYREMAMQAELEMAIDDIVNEAVVVSDSGLSVELNTDNLEDVDKKIKKMIEDEFENVLKLLNFGNMGHDIFKRWYVDGRLFYHVIIDETDLKAGIKELRYIDPRRIRKIREIQKTKDPRTGAEIIKSQREYYLYNERGIIGAHSNLGTRIAVDSVVNVNSGLMDSRRAMVLSYLHKAIKPLNQLRMVEDATVIYRMSRAPERRVFYIDVGTLPKTKAEQYLKDIMTKYRNKIVYDSSTGELRDDRKHLSMLEDFWLPRREGGKGTEISTLPGGENLGKMEDVEYFRKKMYQSLSVPVSRLEPQQGGIGLGRVAEVTRDELKFTRFIQRLRNKFSTLFDDIMRIQLVMKGICTTEEWNVFREDIWYDFLKDNNFNELKEAELLTNRIALLQAVDPFVGRYWSVGFVRREILKQTDEQIEEIDAEIKEEMESGIIPTMEGPDGQPIPITPEQAAMQQQAEQQAELAAQNQPPEPGMTPDGQPTPTDQNFSKLKMREHRESLNKTVLSTINRRRKVL